MISFKMILEFDPAAYKYHISTINTKLNHLFVLATSRECTLLPMERIQHTITCYAQIKQPEPNGSKLNPTTLMKAALPSAKIL
jgi:hypothetical protein